MTMRRWKGWALLEHDERLSRVAITDPAMTEAGRQLLDMGWKSIPVDIIERDADDD